MSVATSGLVTTPPKSLRDEGLHFVEQPNSVGLFHHLST